MLFSGFCLIWYIQLSNDHLTQKRKKMFITIPWASFFLGEIICRVWLKIRTGLTISASYDLIHGKITMKTLLIGYVWWYWYRHIWMYKLFLIIGQMLLLLRCRISKDSPPKTTLLPVLVVGIAVAVGLKKIVSRANNDKNTNDQSKHS